MICAKSGHGAFQKQHDNGEFACPGFKMISSNIDTLFKRGIFTSESNSDIDSIIISWGQLLRSQKQKGRVSPPRRATPPTPPRADFPATASPRVTGWGAPKKDTFPPLPSSPAWGKEQALRRTAPQLTTSKTEVDHTSPREPGDNSAATDNNNNNEDEDDDFGIFGKEFGFIDATPKDQKKPTERIEFGMSSDAYLEICMDREHLIAETKETTVYRAVMNQYGCEEPVAVKLWQLPQNESTDDYKKNLKQWNDEQSIISQAARVNNASVVFIHTPVKFAYPRFGGPTYLGIVMPLYDGHLGQLYDRSKFGREDTLVKKVSSANGARALCRQICQAYASCHRNSPQIVHRDVKPANVLFSSNFEVVDGIPVPQLKLCDFAHAKLFKPIEGSVAHTKVKPHNGAYTKRFQEYWTPPEMAGKGTRAQHRASVDLWGMGLLIFFVASRGNALFKTKSEALEGSPSRTIQARKQETGFKTKHLRFALFEDLICKLVRVEPSERISAETALLHPAMWTNKQIADFLFELVRSAESGDRAANIVLSRAALDHIPENWFKSLDERRQILLKAHLRDKPEVEQKKFDPSGSYEFFIKFRNCYAHLKQARQFVTDPVQVLADMVVEVSPTLLPALVDLVMEVYEHEAIQADQRSGSIQFYLLQDPDLGMSVSGDSNA